MRSTLHQFHSDSGTPMDAHFEVQGGQLVLHSRGGAIGTPHAQNTEYAQALRVLLTRIQKFNLNLVGVWLDSNRVQNLPLEERSIFSPKDSELSPNRLFTELSKKMAVTGRGPNTKSNRGNPNKRLRFAFSGNIPDEQIALVTGWGQNKTDAPVDNAVPLSPSDQEWVEGHQKLVTHLRRERGKGLAQAKKARFKFKHGRLFCERCKLDPAEVYGPSISDACIEVHHKLPVASMVPGHITRLEDLVCLCANCHRIIHRELQNRD